MSGVDNGYDDGHDFGVYKVPSNAGLAHPSMFSSGEDDYGNLDVKPNQVGPTQEITAWLARECVGGGW